MPVDEPTSDDDATAGALEPAPDLLEGVDLLCVSPGLSLEEGVVRIARQGASLTFPASVLFVACTNPCPCGRIATECQCSDAQRARYAHRLSAPLRVLDVFLRAIGLAA